MLLSTADTAHSGLSHGYLPLIVTRATLYFTSGGAMTCGSLEAQKSDSGNYQVINLLTTDDECTGHATLATCYQLAQSI